VDPNNPTPVVDPNTPTPVMDPIKPTDPFTPGNTFNWFDDTKVATGKPPVATCGAPVPVAAAAPVGPHPGGLERVQDGGVRRRIHGAPDRVDHAVADVARDAVEVRRFERGEIRPG